MRMEIPCAFDIGVWSSKIRQTTAEWLADMRLKTEATGKRGRGRTACLQARLRGKRPAEFRRQSRRNVRPRAAYTNPLPRCRSSVYAAALFTNGLYRSKSFMFPETVSAAGAATLPAGLSAPRKGCPSAAAPADTPEWPGSPAAAAPPRSAPDYGILRPKH